MDEDLEFRDMVLKKLAENGSLLGIKAKLRAMLYNIIEKEQPGAENALESDISSSTFERDSDAQLDGKSLAYELMVEMLSSCNLNYTKQILLAESGHPRATITREQMIRYLGLQTTETDDDAQRQPLLLRIIEKMRSDTGEALEGVNDTATELSSESKVCSKTEDDNTDTQNNLTNE